MVFPKHADLASAYVLHFLSGHDRDEAVKFFDKEDVAVLSPDIPAIINLDVASRTFTVAISRIGGAVNKSVWTWENPGSKWFCTLLAAAVTRC